MPTLDLPSTPAGEPAFLPLDPSVGPTRLAVIARRAQHWTHLWRSEVRFDADRRWSTRVGAGRGYEIWVLTWLPGQGTEPHDHGGSAGAFAVVQGRLREDSATLRSDGEAAWTSREVRPGQVRSFGPGYLHDVRNDSADPAISLHVYGPALTRLTRYRVAKGRLVTDVVEHAGADW